MPLRQVQVYKYERKQGNIHFDKVENGTAIFHGFGVDYEEFETGPGNFSTAIIERDDGSVENVPVELIRFYS